MNATMNATKAPLPCVMQKFQVWVCVKILHPDWSKHIMWFSDWLAVPSSSLCLLCLFLYQTAIPLIRNINKKNAATAPMVPPMTAPILLPGPVDEVTVLIGAVVPTVVGGLKVF